MPGIERDPAPLAHDDVRAIVREELTNVGDQVAYGTNLRPVGAPDTSEGTNLIRYFHNLGKQSGIELSAGIDAAAERLRTSQSRLEVAKLGS